jgi:putative ABC transport system ATP-binding protein
MTSTALFAFDRVTVAGEERPRLEAVSVEIAGDGITAVAGPSGAGKSTLLRCCNRLDAPDSGVVRHRGNEVARLDPLAHRRAVGMVFQAPVLFPGTVADNLRVADPDAGAERVAELLRRAALDPESLAGREADTLSGGEAQRVCLARALATNPEVLLMDEPTAALDGEATAELERLMRALAADGVPVVLVTHDEAQLERVADHVIRLRDGRLDGAPEDRLGG